MTFDFIPEEKTLKITDDKGITRKYIFQDKVGELFSMILLQLEATSGGGSEVTPCATWAEEGNTDKIPEEKIPDMFDNVDVVNALPAEGVQDRIYVVTSEEGKRYYWDGSAFQPLEAIGGITIGTVTGTAYDGGKGTELETKVTDLEATVADKLGTLDVATWAKAEDPTTIPLEKMDENVVEYSDFSYTPSGESQPVERKTIQLANYDSISGMNTAGNDAANLIMMSKWNKVDIGSSRYPVNLNGSEFTINDNRDIARVYETNGLTSLSEGAPDSEIRSALGLDFEKLIEIIQDKDVVIIDRTPVGDYKTCIHASGNISSGNGAVNLMFFIGTTPTIYQVQHVSGTYALAVISYEFASKDEIPTDVVSHEELNTAITGVEGKIPDVSDLTANVSTVGESVQIGQEAKGLNLKTSGDIYSGAMINSSGYIPTMTPYPGEDGRYVLQMRNQDSLSGIGTDGATGGNLVMLSKYDVADYGSKNFHTNLNVKEDNGHNGRVTVNDDNEIAYLSDIPEVSGFATTQNLSDSISAEASARDKAIETATSDLVHNTTTVAGKSLTGNITIASTDLTDNDDIVKKEGLADEVLGVVINDNNETLKQTTPIKTQLPFARNTPLQNQTEQQIFNLFDKSGNTTSRAELYQFLQSNPVYVFYLYNSMGQHTYYKIPILMTDVPDSGDITVIMVGPDIYNDNKITKFTYTIVLNGNASSVTIEKKVLES